MRALLLMAVMLGVACQDTFEAPPLPDLYKSPKDLSASISDGGMPDDLATAGDLGKRDLAIVKDLTIISQDHDLAEVDAN